MQSKGAKILALIAVTVVVATLSVIGYNRWFGEAANPSKERYPIRGIDVSAHNGEIDFKQLANEEQPAFIYIKATEGTDFIDRNYIRNCRGAFLNGIPAGAYHFFRFDTDAEMQAINFLAALRGRQFQLPPAIDIEEWGNPDGHATAQIVERLRTMINYLETAGYSPILYTNKDGYYRFIRGNFDKYPLWICSFTDPPLDTPANLLIWQYSHRGSIAGIPSSTDLNAFCSTAEAFIRFTGNQQ